MDRRTFVGVGVAGAAASALPACDQPPPATAASQRTDAPAVAAFELDEITIADLRRDMESGARTSRSIVEAYIDRIRAIDGAGPMLRSVIETNPEALDIADALDRERRERGARGPLHGIPVLIKDNIATGERMLTTAGSRALAGGPAARDAFVADRLRAAGAVLLGKTNLSEWANFRSTRSTSGWSGRGGQCRNPYALDRSPCGSSSGTGAAIAASLAAAGVGTETDGSIVCPSSANSLVGIKPTLGLVSRSGIVPISHSQDTAGPMARTVADAAALLGAMTGVDARDAVTADGAAHTRTDYGEFLDANGLEGARIGVARSKFFGYSPDADRLVEAAIEAMRAHGAVIVDPADIPHAGEYDDSELTVLLYEFKADLNAWLAEMAGAAQVHTLADIIAFNEANAATEMPFFGQEIMHQAQEKGPLTDAAYREALARDLRLSRGEGIDAVMKKHSLDAIVAPTGSPAWTIDLVNGDHFLGASSTPAAVAGYPSISVPVGYAFGLPVGMSLIGAAWSEPTLIRIAYAYEQAVGLRRPPRFLPTAELTA